MNREVVQGYDGVMMDALDSMVIRYLNALDSMVIRYLNAYIECFDDPRDTSHVSVTHTEVGTFTVFCSESRNGRIGDRLRNMRSLPLVHADGPRLYFFNVVVDTYGMPLEAF